MHCSRNVISAIHDRFFATVHGHWLIYNTCWEDPRIDRQLLKLDRHSKIVMLTSAGCNALDYLLDTPAEIHAVDSNPRQNALLHLKLALVVHGNFDDLFAMFGVGSHSTYGNLYGALKSQLPAYAQAFWNGRRYYFDGSGVKKSFYYYGTSGTVAWTLRQYLSVAKQNLRQHLLALLEAQTIAEQQDIYRDLEPVLWRGLSSWLVNRSAILALLGVPRAQIRLIRQHHPKGVAGYAHEKLRQVLTAVPMRDNYFWRVYLTGSYTSTCCPNYLKKEYFSLLQENVRNVATYNLTLSEFLRRHPGKYTHFILLDHQDWLAGHDPESLREEWRLLLANSQPGTKILLRSAGAELDFLPPGVKSLVRFSPALTRMLHQQDRVGTYGSVHLAEVL